MYLFWVDNTNHPKLLNISNTGEKRWERAVPEEYQYYKGVDKDGNFYGAAWAEENDWAPTISKIGYDDGAVKWSLAEQHSGAIDDIYVDGQARLYTVGFLMDPIGDADFYIARYAGGDAISPAQVPDLTVTELSSGSIALSWTAPGDDGIMGTASSYDICYTTTGAIVSAADFTAATQVQGEPVPQTAGSAETFTLTGLTPGTTYFFALKTIDEAGNVSGLSNSPQGATAAVPVEKYSLRKYAPPEPHIATVSAWSAPLVSLVNIFGTTNPAREIGMSFSVSAYPAGAEGFSLSKSSEATNTQGLADVLLKLGSIPAEYGVTATCANCEALASSVTFTCCGKIPNEDFKQSSSTWANQHYDNICSTEPANTGNYRPVYTCSATIFNNPQYQKYKFTVRAKGCALSALTTLINHYRDAYNLPISSATPAILNKYLNDNSGYDNGAVWFESIAPFSNNYVTFLGAKNEGVNGITRPQLIKDIDKDILENKPVIIRVPGHFLLVTGKCGSKYIVSDPAPISGGNVLYDPNGLRPLKGTR
jgi:hypothetical protein